MDIFLRNLPEQCTDRQLTEFLHEYLKPIGDPAFLVRKLKNKSCAILTVSNHFAGKKFLQRHGSEKESKTPAISPLKFLQKNVYCSASKTPPDPFVVQGLQQQEEERRKRKGNGAKKEAQPIAKGEITEKHKGPRNHTFAIESIACGQWNYFRNRLAFLECYSDPRRGSVIFGGKSLVVFLHKTAQQPKNIRIDIDYSIIDSIIVGTLSDRSTVSFTLLQAPAFSTIEIEAEHEEDEWISAKALATMLGEDPKDELDEALQDLTLGSGMPRRIPRAAKRARVCSLAAAHEAVASACWVYQVVIADHRDLNLIQQTLRNTHGTPPHLWHPTSRSPRYDYAKDFQNLMSELTDTTKGLGLIPYPILYQLQRLAQNGYLNPKAVRELLPHVRKLAKERGANVTAIAEGIRALSNMLPNPGPDVDASIFATKNMVDIIKKKAASFKYHDSDYAHSANHPHLMMVHKVLVTPAGTYLEGPDVDVKNRVIRKYPKRTDYFIRVTFADEDGQSVHLPQYIDGHQVYRTRFANVLNGNINIAGRVFVVLGWSHSSLRTNQCWYAAPFVDSGNIVSARQVIKELGDFSTIRCPAKCAARIGQTFSDSTDTIQIQENAVTIIPDIERNERVFTDGVGQISLELLRKVWQEFRKSRRSHATIVQIRYQGAKGILALNPALKGEALHLRKSMTKFQGSRDDTLEICGASYKKLPMYLNRPLIKILEDMGALPSAFIALQERAIHTLKYITTHPINAARFLEHNMIGLAARVPRLIRLMTKMGINFRDDKFLRDVVELAALVQVRDLKHRARIPIENGVTLYGTVDETGLLKEREVYVPTRDIDGKRKVLLGPCLVTRSPALHPGDVQLVEAINVPESSSLNQLHNCVVFSQHGSRDLPSMLSGGDLDGDLYNVIFEESIWPKKQFEPADYPRTEAIDIGCAVEVADMTDFFLKFMESDKLGFIANTHLQIADHKPEGALHPDCLLLAEMASTAVDFSKTGVPVDMDRMPKDFNRKAKPDFMASAPRLIMKGGVGIEELKLVDEDENDPVRALDPSSRPTTYYRSTKVLGHLYRNIDETQFLHEMQSKHVGDANISMLKEMWQYASRETRSVLWRPQLGVARQIRDAYETALVDTMYQFASNPREPLSEIEVFTGTILGKSGGMPSGRVRQYNMDMKAKADRDIQYIVEWILRDEPEEEVDDDDGYDDNYYDDDDDQQNYNFTTTDADTFPQDYNGDDIYEMQLGGTNETLARSLACFYSAVHEAGRQMPKTGPLRSFAYVAAAVCLQEVEKFQELESLSW